MFRHHQGAKLLESVLVGNGETGINEWQVPEVTESVSENEEGIITVTLNNLSLADTKSLEITVGEHCGTYDVVEAHVVTGERQACNTFDAPETVKEEAFTTYEVKEQAISLELPPRSVVELRFRLC